MDNAAYQATSQLWPSTIFTQAAATGMVQASSGSVLGFSALATATLNGAVLGAAPVVGALVMFDQTIP